MAQVAKALDHGKRVGISAYDFSATFDTVEAAELESKLPWASEQARKIIMNYLNWANRESHGMVAFKKQMRLSMGSGKARS